MVFYGTVREFFELLSGDNDALDLDAAALELARIESPGLDPRPYLDQLDDLAGALAARLPSQATGPDYVAIANEYLFEEAGFYGDESDYYNPLNSCLNQVLERRTGIPITLSVLYMEIARRLGRPVYGIGLPGHFLVQYNDGRFSTYVDVFHAGRLLTRDRCRELARSVAGVDIAGDPAVFQPAGKRPILLRMLNNLRGAYFRRQAHRKALGVLDLLIRAMPASADEYKQRGALHLQLKQYAAARADLEHYLRLVPSAPDRAELEQQLQRVRRWIAALN